jgi:hypothetical protein
MGYLNNASVTVDAILTTKGRELLSKGTINGLDIRYFALGDDEVNYDLWNPAHPLGSDYYGIVIENMPVLEASPIPEQNLKSKLITIADRNTTSLSKITNVPTSIGFQFVYNSGVGNRSQEITPLVTTGNNNIFGYNLTYDTRYLSVTVLQNAQNVITGSATIGDSTSFTKTVSGLKFNVVIKSNVKNADLPYFAPTVTFGTQILLEGNEIGGRSSIPVNISYSPAP